MTYDSKRPATVHGRVRRDRNDRGRQSRYRKTRCPCGSCCGFGVCTPARVAVSFPWTPAAVRPAPYSDITRTKGRGKTTLPGGNSLTHHRLTWHPRYTLTPAIARWLMNIEAARAVVEHTPLPPAVEAELRRRARVRSTHYSTRIEGNRLTLAEAEQVVEGKRVAFHGRERDVGEVRNYWNALLRVEEWAQKRMPLTPSLLRRERAHGAAAGHLHPAARGLRFERPPFPGGAPCPRPGGLLALAGGSPPPQLLRGAGRGGPDPLARVLHQDRGGSLCGGESGGAARCRRAVHPGAGCSPPPRSPGAVGPGAIRT